MSQEEFSIQFVSRVTGINPHTIRAWEKRYQVVVPNRDPKGRRLYNQSHIDRLNMIQQLVEVGNKISDMAKLDDQSLENLCDQYCNNDRQVLSKGLNGHGQSLSEEKIDPNTVLQSLLMALQNYKLDIISHELEKVKGQMDPREFTLSILLPLLSEVGGQVQRRLLSIAQEYALTSLLKFHVGQILYNSYQYRMKGPVSVLLTTPEGEIHDFGILTAALLCSHYKVNFYYLGANLPMEAMLEAYDQIKPQVVISTISRSVDEFPENYIEHYVEKANSHLAPEGELWLGGVSNLFINKPISNTKIFSTIRSLDQMLRNF
ncbi:MAG: MerR family transcriptional regulator [Bacteriovoracaceae bacterium]